MPDIARNPRTGEVFILSPEGRWEPAERVRNPQTGQEFFFDGERWVDVSDLRPLEDTRRDPTATGMRQPENTRFERFLTGLTDIPAGGAQFLTNNLPRGVVDAVNNAIAWVNRDPLYWGPITRAIGMTPMTPEQARENVAQRQAAYRDARERAGLSPEGFDPYRLAGQIVPTLPAMAAPVARTLTGAALQGAAVGTGLGAATPIDAEGDEYRRRLNEALRFGAMAGAAGGVAGNLLGRALAPRVDPQVERLHRAGVELTPGQVMGGTARRVEDQLASFPLGIDAARRRGIESFNRAVADEVLAPLGQRAPRDVPAGRELLQAVERTIQSSYDDALSRIPPLRPDAEFARRLNEMAASRFLTPSAQQQFREAITQRILPRLQGDTIDPRTFQTVTSELGALARSYQGSGEVALRELADAFRGTREVFFDLLARRAPEAAQRLQAANQAYAGLTRMQTAAGMQGATEGIFTPAQFSHAVRQADTSLRRTAYARGDALLQELSDAGRAVLPQTVPDSGTAGRALTGLLVSGGASSWLNSPTPLAAFLASQALYSRPVNQAIVNAMLAPRPQAVVAAGEAARRMSAPVTVQLGDMLLSPPPHVLPETMR